MEIRRWLCYAVNCALVCCIVGKQFSLNKIIETESHQRVIHTTLTPILQDSEPLAERFSLNKGLKPLSRISKKLKETDPTHNFISLSKKISPLKYRKTFQIKSPLKPKRVKHSLRTRQKRKNQAVKREINGNEKLNQKYIPLLRNLAMLFDNILGTDSGEAFQIPRNTRKQLRYYLEGSDDDSCQCLRPRESNAGPESEKETVNFPETLSTEASPTTKASAETTDNPTPSDLRSFRQHKNLPLLLPRDTIGARRNDHGLGERSRAAHNGGTERDISRNYGDSEHNTEWEQDKPYAKSNEEHTYSDSRHGASSVQSRGGLRRGGAPRNNTEAHETIHESNSFSKNQVENALDSPRGHIDELNGQDKLKTGRDKAQSAKLLPEPVRRQRGFLSKDEVGDTAESVQSEEDNEKSDLGVAHDSSDDQRIFDRSGSSSSENQKVSPRYERVIAHDSSDDQQIFDRSGSSSSENQKVIPRYERVIAHDSSDDQRFFDRSGSSSSENQKVTSGHETVVVAHDSFDDQRIFDRSGSSSSENQKVSPEHERVVYQSHEPFIPQKSSKNTRTEGPVVVIIDGYSVTRNKNGQNKLAEKAIRIRP